ncbi:MAG: restriction endonuclease subunit S [Flavobacterium sp.]
MIAETKNTKAFYNTEIPSDWSISHLGELGVFSKGKGILKEQVIEEGLPCIRYGEIYTTHDFIIKKFKSFINDNVAKESKEIKRGDILFAGSGETVEEIGKAVAYLGNEKAYAGGDVVILSTNNGVNAECLSYVLETDFVRRQKRVLGQGNSVVHIYSSDLSKVKIPLPPLPEQKAIAQVLSTADAAIHTTEKIIAQKELRKKWLMQQLLTGKKRLKGFGGEWKEHSYEKILKVVKRNFDWDENELYKLISVRRRSGGIFYREALFGHQILVKTLRTANEGDFLFSKMQILHGASALVTKEFDGAKISGSYIAVVPKDQKLLNMEFFQWYSQTPYFYHQTYISSYGVHIEKMTFDFDTFLQLEMKLPSTEEQTAITQVLQAADKEISLLKAKAEKLREQKKGLMQQLLTGKVRLKIN